jgi:F-type H+-transporting ATPase subunit b
MDIKTLILESNLINFTIVAVAIAYFLVKLIPDSTKKRQAEIQKQLTDAQKAKEDAEAKLQELEVEIEVAKLESKKIIESANENAVSIKSQIVKDAQIEISRLKANAQREIQMNKDIAINNIKDKLRELTINAVQNSLKERQSEVDQLIKQKVANDLKEKIA